jgi:hypothetical protein
MVANSKDGLVEGKGWALRRRNVLATTYKGRHGGWVEDLADAYVSTVAVMSATRIDEGYYYRMVPVIVRTTRKVSLDFDGDRPQDNHPTNSK